VPLREIGLVVAREEARLKPPLDLSGRLLEAREDSPEFGIGDEGAFFRAGTFDGGEGGLLLFGSERKAQLLGLDGDAVEAAFFAEDDGAGGADEVGGKGFDGLRNVELAGDGAAFAHKEILADDGLPRFELMAGGAADESGNFANFPEIEFDGNAIESTESQGDFADVGVAGALAHAVDGGLNPLGAGADGGDGASGGHAEVVVAMKVKRDGRAGPFVDLANEEFDGFGAAGANGVDDDELLGAGVESVAIEIAERVEFGARAVDGEEGDTDAVGASVSDGVGGTAFGFVNCEAIGFQLDGAGGSFDDGGSSAKAQEFVDVGFDGAAKTPNFSFEAGFGDEAEGFSVIGGDAREARFDPADAQIVERARDFKFLCGSEDDTNALLAVAQSSVVEPDGAIGGERFSNVGAIVEFAGPEAVFVGKISHW
jgi:hypothetical protein